MTHTPDVTVILGGGVKDAQTLSTATLGRLELALQHYQGEYLLVAGAGPFGCPLLVDHRGFPVYESLLSARWLLLQGIPANRILVESSSYDTIGNAYFSLVTHILPRQWQVLRIVTSQFHLPRTEVVFRWIVGLLGQKTNYNFQFLGVTDDHFSPDQMRHQSAKELDRLGTLIELQQNLTSLQLFHDWLFSQHGAYSLES